MYYSKLLFLSVSLMLSSSMFAADVPSNKSSQSSGLKKYLLKGPNNMNMSFSDVPDRPIRDLLEEYRKRFNLPREYVIRLTLESGIAEAYKLLSDFKFATMGGFRIWIHDQHNKVPNFEALTNLIWVKNSIGIKIMAFDKNPDRLVSELAKEYRNEYSLDPSFDVNFKVEKTQIPLKGDVLLSAYAIPHNRILVERTAKKSDVSATEVSTAPISAMSADAPIVQEVTLHWFAASSKKAYFTDKYEKLEPLVGLKTSDYDGFLNFKDGEDSRLSYIHLRNDIIKEMNELRISTVIKDMLIRLTSESSDDYRMLEKLVKPEMVCAIAALQKLCGKGRKEGFQYDEYDETALDRYPEKKDFINPLLRIVSPGINMTIYRFLHSMIGELDGVPVVKDSLLYKILDTFDKSLTEIIKQ